MSEIKQGELGFTDNRVKSGQFEYLNFDTGDVKRIVILSDSVYMIRRHYNDSVRKYVRCLEEDGYCPACLDPDTGNATEVYSVFAFEYSTNKAGTKLNPGDLVEEGRVVLWKFTAKKYTQLRTIAEMNEGLEAIDLVITCTDKNFMKLNILPAPKCLAKSQEGAWDELMLVKQDLEELDRGGLTQKKLSVEEMVELLALDDSYIDNAPEKSNKKPKVDKVVSKAAKPAKATNSSKVEPTTLSYGSIEEIEGMPVDKALLKAIISEDLLEEIAARFEEDTDAFEELEGVSAKRKYLYAQYKNTVIPALEEEEETSVTDDLDDEFDDDEFGDED